jgi:lysozyme
MAIDASQLMLSTGRLANANTPGIFGQLSAAVDQNNELAMRKQQLEMQKQQYDQQRQMEEARLALQRQSMFLDKAREDRSMEAQRQAAKRKDDEEKLGLSTKFSQTLLSGDRVGAEAMLPEMEARGMQAVKEREENGLPVYRVYQSREERMKEDQEYQRRVNMARASDIRPEDVTIQRGGSVVDLPGAESRRQAETDAVLQEQALAYPEGDERNMYLQSARAALKVPGPTPGRVAAADQLASGPMQNYRSRQQADASRDVAKNQLTAAREARAQSGEGRADVKLRREGEEMGSKRAQEAAANIAIKEYREFKDQLAIGREALNNRSNADDHMAGTLVGRAVGGEKGPLSDKDVYRVLGDAGEDFWSRIKNKLYSEAIGGLPQPKRKALTDLIDEKNKQLDDNLGGFVDRIDELAEKEGDKDVAEGMRKYLDVNIERPFLEERRKARKPKASDKPAAEQPTGAAAPASVDGKQLIKDFEGKRLEAYPDAKGHSIGYGHYGAKPGQKVTEEEAEQLFEQDYARFAKVVDEVAPNATQQQRDAMISLAYNIGEEGFRGSSVAKMHAAGDTAGAAKAFDLYNKSEGKVNSSLVLRRKRERELYESAGAATDLQPQSPEDAELLELLKKGG